MLRYGHTQPRTAAGRAERDKRVQDVLRVLGDRELLAADIATRLDWSDWMTGAVLDAAMASKQVTRRREAKDGRLPRAHATGYPRQTCWVYRATVPRVPEPRRHQPPRMIFRPLPEA